MPKRVNKAIELLEDDLPVFYTGSHTGANLNYDAGLAMAKTWADYINVGMEHGSFDLGGLDNFMRGLADGGPTNSGHKTPAVIVELPVDGISADVIRANGWQMRQLLARGVHGLLLCHAESPEAVKAFVEACRYPFQTIGVGTQLDVGRRGSAGQGSAAPIWGISANEYLDVADPWPLNPNGELFLGLKFENKRALANVEITAQVPGIAFAEWGPGDMSMSFGYKNPPNPRPKELQEARDRVFAACKNAGIRFLESTSPDTIEASIDAGVRITGGGEEAARIGRAYAGRTMPV
ncbi:MAG: aldolase/citrate lyase family protein [Candidatus Poribacteria bacterium]|nr:aldolase/citrate lyase family protein [Candidatus Poribacteria bacterium]